MLLNEKYSGKCDKAGDDFAHSRDLAGSIHCLPKKRSKSAFLSFLSIRLQKQWIGANRRFPSSSSSASKRILCPPPPSLPSLSPI